MKFLNPACLINNLLRRTHSKKAYEKLVHEDLDQTQKFVHEDHQEQTQKTSKNKKQGLSRPKGSPKTFDVYVGVGDEEKKYRVSIKYFGHPKLRELIDKYRPFVLDPRASNPIAVECSTELFEQVLRSVVKNR